MELFVTVVYHDHMVNHIPFVSLAEADKYMDSMREEINHKLAEGYPQSIASMHLTKVGFFPVVLTSRVFATTIWLRVDTFPDPSVE